MRNKFKKTKNRKPVFIIAEMAWSHDGSVNKAKRIIRGAARAGADAISFHITNMEDYMVKGYGCSASEILKNKKRKTTIYNYLDKINLKEKDWKKLFAFAKGLKLKICAMPNDKKSLKLCSKLNPQMYVLAAACFSEEDFIIEMAKKRKPVILRIGGATLSEIEKVINLIKKNGNSKIILLHGIQLYPTKIENTNLNLIPFLKKKFSLPVGLADHIDAESEMSLIVPLLAVPLGVGVIEKHLTHDRSQKGVDFEAALNPNEFKKFVDYIRETEKALGVPYFKSLSGPELKYRKTARKRTVALEDIKRGEKITKKNITFKRSDKGVYPDEIKKILGKKTKFDIKKDEPILKNKIK